VGDVEAFLGQRFGREPHLHEGDGRFDDLLSLADVDRALTGAGLRFPAVRLVRDGEVLERASFTRRARTGSTTVTDLIDAGRALDLFAGGATIVLQSLQRWWDPLARFCRELELALGHQVQANAYLTPSGAAGLAPHHDTHDVFVLQVAGTKQWRVAEPVVATPLPGQRSDHDAAARQPTLFETGLAPGDCMYLPRGYVHSARAQEGVSLHVTIGVLATTVHDLLRRVVDRTADEERFRRSLAPGYHDDPAAARSVVKSAVTELLEWLERLDPEPLASELQDRFWSRRPQLLDGQLLELAGLATLDDDSTVRRRHASICRYEPLGDRLRLGLGDRSVDLPAAVEPAVRRLAAGPPVRVGDLDDLLDGPSRLVLVRRLIREGLLRADHAR
jgi:bifunctional lysine-specific demethylase and histidyl-hydroxylase NO66